MKNIITLLFFILVISCKSNKPENLAKPSTIQKNDFSELVEGKVYKIDSINNYYLIYLKSKKIDYKIVSKKNNCEKSNLIKIDSTYSFKLEPIFKISNNGNQSIANYLDLKRCQYFDGNTTICNEPGIELYKSSNVYGLCIF